MDSTKAVLFFISKPLRVLVVSRPKKVDCVVFMAQHHHVFQIQTGLHVFKIAHEMFLRTCAHHVIHVTQEDRIIGSLCTFLHIRLRIGNQLAVVHVVDFLCVVNTPGLGRDLESLKSFLAKRYLGKSPLVLQVLVPRALALIQLASEVYEMHSDNLQEQLDFRELLQS